MRQFSPLVERKSAVAVLGVCVCISVALVAWFGYTAMRGWQRSSRALADRRAEDAAALLVSELTNDMMGVTRMVLAAVPWTPAMFAPPFDAIEPVTNAFARYPYPEWFFGSTAADPSAVVLLARPDGLPAWLPAAGGANHAPIAIIHNPPIDRAMIEHVWRDARAGRRLSAFETTLGGTPYQVVAGVVWRTPRPIDVDVVVGFVVNLTWARERYFRELARHAERLGPASAGVALSIVDDAGQEIAATDTGGVTGSEVRRPFPLAFFVPTLLLGNLQTDWPNRQWTVRAVSWHDPALVEASRAGTRMLVFGAMAAVTLLLGFVLTVRAGVSSVRLAELRADFVASVTHELKTPIATIRAAGETLLAGRISDQATRHEYVGIVVQEAKRLTQLIENLLEFSRITDARVVRAFEPVQLDVLVPDTVRRFDVQLRRAGFRVTIAFSPDSPSVLGDPAALRLMLDNILANAIRYAGDVRRIGISGRVSEGSVIVDITDHGIGIHPKDVPHVTKKFFRARNATPGGTGVGLAIADRIVTDHGGSIAVESTIDQGTTLIVTLPIASPLRAREGLV